MVCARRGLIYSGLSVCVCANARAVGLVKYVNISGARARADTLDVTPVPLQRIRKEERGRGELRGRNGTRVANGEQWNIIDGESNSKS